MKNDPDRMSVTVTHPTDTMPQIHSIAPTCPLHWTLSDGKRDRISLPQRHHFWPRLHARTLLGQHEFTPQKVTPGFREQDCHLDGEDVLAIEVLMKAIVISFLI